MDVEDKQKARIDSKIKWIEDKSKKATALTKDIRTKNSRFAKIVSDLETINDQVITLTKQYKSYQATEKNIEINLKKAERFYDTRFSSLQNKIEDKELGLPKAISESKKLINELTRKRDEIANKNKQYQDNVTELKSILAKSKSAEKSISVSDGKVTSFKNNIEKHFHRAEELLKSIKGIVQTSKQKQGEISKLLEESKSKNIEIEKLKNSAETSNQKILDYEEDSKVTNKKISDLYGIANNSVIAGAFQTIQKDTKEELGKWNTKILIWSSILAVILILIFVLQLIANSWTLEGLSYDFYLRFLLATPVVYYLLFCSAQYSNVRTKLDKYTYKTTLALSIEAHTELLNKNFSDDKYKTSVLQFSLDLLEKIYDRPYVDDYLMAQLKESKNTEISESTIATVKEKLLLKDNEFMKSFKGMMDDASKD